MSGGNSVRSDVLLIPKFLKENYDLLRDFISDVMMSRGNRKFLLTNLPIQIWGVTINLPIMQIGQYHSSFIN
jgi:hypothetical protein